MERRERNFDRVEKIGGALVQHGHLSNRIYLMDINDAHPEKLITRLEELAKEKDYTKVFAKVPSSRVGSFLDAGYREEASVPRYYRGEDALFLGLYLEERRAECSDPESLKQVLLSAIESNGKKTDEVSPLETIRRCTEDDIEAMSRIYGEVFSTYPFPIFDPEYILKTMKSHVIYFGVEVMGHLAALASAEIDDKYGNVEFTDFATRPKWRGNGFAPHLLEVMETEIKKLGIQTAYTIARASLPGINTIFSKNGYTYSGTLTNNTNISGQIESMNVWYKDLARVE